MKDKSIRFTRFIDGDCVNSCDGILSDGALTVEVLAECGPNREIYINSTRAKEIKKGVYSAPVSLFEVKNTVVCEDRTVGAEEKMLLYRFPHHDERLFHISSDDNIIFLEELTKGNYKSIFDHPYLAVYKKAHDLYGAKVHLNLFYEYCDYGMKSFSRNMKYFNLSMMTDRYKDEWIANSDWLKLAFHSKNETPRPYVNATREQIREDVLAVHREIKRFAGESSISNTTTIHYGGANLECVRELRALGFSSLTGYFINRNGRPRVAYYLDTEITDHVEGRDMWVDTEEDITLVRIDRVLNEAKNEENLLYLDALTKDPHRGGFISIMIHEQYFYSDYARHIPDFEKIVLDAAKLLYERGYRGAHVCELTSEKKPSEYG